MRSNFETAEYFANLQFNMIEYIGIPGSKPRPALLPLDLLLKAPSFMFRSHVMKIEDSLVTGWKSHSLPAVILRNLKDHASAGIAVSQRKVRQISDPIQQILIQLHKIIYITQLPPTLHCNLKRRVIERFKKSLFSQQSNPCHLKSEIKKVPYSAYHSQTTYFGDGPCISTIHGERGIIQPEDEDLKF
ncbi:hypothetical protein lerEdw1_020199 [Lerista edwardsae]|nr:hypothetical protein lerEdw1_020199 [Lerista edwardsae]